MIGNDGFSMFLDKTFAFLAEGISWILENIFSVIFFNHTVALLAFFIFINLIAIILVKKDKEFAQAGTRRVRESTLLIVALVGGGFGEYYAMYKYKHKTLHKKFLYGVPISIMLNMMMLTYSLTLTLLA
ncbi:MAG: DUF1294 domain-containing protein [Clostridia bacterium]|nr:DUF1294 domain-containing protein [Clostridia bacterium]